MLSQTKSEYITILVDEAPGLLGETGGEMGLSTTVGEEEGVVRLACRALSCTESIYRVNREKNPDGRVNK